MELPPGKTLESLFGGHDVLLGLLDRLGDENLTGFVRTSRFRDEVPAEGTIVFHKGSVVMVDHNSDHYLAGIDSVKEVLRDSLDEDCVMEVHSYDYRSSMISVPHLAGNYPDTAVSVLPDMVTMQAEIMAEETRRREQHLRELEEREARQVNDIIRPCIEHHLRDVYAMFTVSESCYLYQIPKTISQKCPTMKVGYYHFVDGSSFYLIQEHRFGDIARIPF